MVAMARTRGKVVLTIVVIEREHEVESVVNKNGWKKRETDFEEETGRYLSA